jgi:hypothetical protein
MDLFTRAGRNKRGATVMSRLFTSLWGFVLLPLTPAAPAQAPQSPVALYEVTTELGMPHLEENLRYTITHEKRCLTRDALHHLFPILNHPALAGCHLGAAVPLDEGLSYPLVCAARHGTSGSASWQQGNYGITGTLNIKLGGKNMTFFQRVTAIPLGRCD